MSGVGPAASDMPVIVVGCGNAALCAAIAAREEGAQVIVVEAAPKALRGGNSAYTAGIMRVPYDSLDSLMPLLGGLSDFDRHKADVGSYSESAFYDDLARVSEYRADPDLALVVVERAAATLRWLTTLGVRFELSYGHQAYEVDGKFKFWGGLAIGTVGGGPGLIDGLCAAAERLGVVFHYGARAVDLLVEGGVVCGVTIRESGATVTLRGRAVVLASGGFEANRRWRAMYLGSGWDLAKVRGTRFNQGDGIRMALDVGASPRGHWSGCHAVAWDRNAPEFGDIAVGDGFQKHSYPLGIVVNAHGLRFIDEGADFRNYTYAKYGQEILRQPGQFAWQIFDAKVSGLLRDEYRIREVTRVRADSLQDLAERLEGVDAGRVMDTIRTYNAAVDQTMPFDPAVKDGRGTRGLTPAKTNWANTIDAAPFEAYAVTCGVTFTFGGVGVNTSGQVLDEDGGQIPGLFSAGEMVGGLFYFNYPGGSGLTAGSVLGRLAGLRAAATK